MLGKEKCKALKEVRRKIAEQNDIEYAVSECSYQGECKGTCPRCEEELQYLEKELERRKKIGKAVIIGGISVGVIAGAVVAKEAVSNFIEEELDKSTTTGAIAPIE